MELLTLTLTISAGVLIAALSFFITGFTSIRTVYLSMNIPGPTLWEFVTVHARGLIGDNLAEHTWKMCADFGHKPWGMWTPNGFAVVVSDCESVSQVYKNKHLTNRADMLIEHLVKYLGKGLMTLNAEEHRFHRKLFSPVFRKNLLESKLFDINDKAAKLVQQIRENGEGSLNVCHLVDDHIGAILMLIFMSDKFPFEKYRRFVHVIKDVSIYVHMRAMNPVYYWLVYKVKTSTRRFETTLKRTVKEVCQRFATDLNMILTKRTRMPYEKTTCPTDVLMDVFAMLGTDAVVDESLHIFCAGLDTTAFVVNITLLLLALHPAVQEKVLEEIRSTVGSVDRYAAVEDLANMVYLEMVLKEVLRLFPAVPLVARRAEEETKIGDVLIPKGSTVITQLMAVNRDPKHFKDPLRFDPERFSPEVSQGRHPFAYVPFGGGNRVCPGQVLAMMVLKTVIYHVVGNFKILPGDEFKNVHDIPTSMYFTLKLIKSSLRFVPRGTPI